jgi:hypothetical protein
VRAKDVVSHLACHHATELDARLSSHCDVTSSSHLVSNWKRAMDDAYHVAHHYAREPDVCLSTVSDFYVYSQSLVYRLLDD